jgi:hypothetical protein
VTEKGVLRRSDSVRQPLLKRARVECGATAGFRLRRFAALRWLRWLGKLVGQIRLRTHEAACT